MEPERSLTRVHNRSYLTKTKVDRIESRGSEFQEKVRRGYLELAKRNSRMIIVSASAKSIKENSNGVDYHRKSQTT